jgi:hypothetical protein
MLGCAAAGCGRTTATSLSPGLEGEARLGVADANNATPVLASWGRFVVAVWTAEKGGATDVYAATSDDTV